MNINEIMKRVENRESFNKNEIIKMLSYPPESRESFFIMHMSRSISDKLTGGKSEVHGQLALNLAPCPKNCIFCSFAAKNHIFKKSTELAPEEAVNQALQLEKAGINALYIMTTATYDFGKFIEISTEIKNNLKEETVMIANVGDSYSNQSAELKDLGYTGVYHAIRLREGIDTDIKPETRMKTINNFEEAGLILGTCVEPVGPEHSNDEIADKILLTDSLNPGFSGAARRITVPGTKLAPLGMISELRMSQILAVTRLSLSRSILGNCTHEPCTLGAAAGANLFWAEIGANPRDIKEKTEEGRGHSVDQCKDLYREANGDILQGRSQYFRNKNI